MPQDDFPFDIFYNHFSGMLHSVQEEIFDQIYAILNHHQILPYNSLVHCIVHANCSLFFRYFWFVSQYIGHLFSSFSNASTAAVLFIYIIETFGQRTAFINYHQMLLALTTVKGSTEFVFIL